MCGGSDRFQYTDRFGEGNYHCRGCGPGGGLKLAQGCLQVGFGELLDRLEKLLGSVTALPVTAEPPPDRMKALCRRLWQEAKPVTAGDEVDRYLSHRGLQLAVYPKTLRCHPSLAYFDKSGTRSVKVAEYPAMLACVQGADGHAVTLHRTYLAGGHKVCGRAAKKLLSAGINGAAVRLQEAGAELSVAEGIETALAVRQRTAMPVWAATSASLLERWEPPLGVRLVVIWADLDRSGAGQAAANRLRDRLLAQGIQVAVHFPPGPIPAGHKGLDWADLWCLALQSAA
jgi:putative DNA primase/helicase